MGYCSLQPVCVALVVILCVLLVICTLLQFALICILRVYGLSYYTFHRYGQMLDSLCIWDVVMHVLHTCSTCSSVLMCCLCIPSCVCCIGLFVHSLDCSYYACMHHCGAVCTLLLQLGSVLFILSACLLHLSVCSIYILADFNALL